MKYVLFSTIFGVLAFYCSIAWCSIIWCSIAWLPLTFTLIGQSNLMNIYYQSKILFSPHRILQRMKAS